MNEINTAAEASDQKPSPAESVPSNPTETSKNASDPPEGSKPTIDVSKLPKIRRRTYVLDRRRQYRTAFLTSSLAALLLIIVNTAFIILRSSQTMAITAAAPELGSTLSQQDSRTGTMLILASVIFVIGVFVITIAETHRTAGAVYAVCRALERVSDGDYRTPLRLRPTDNLRNLRNPFNEMVSTLRKQALAQADDLDRLTKLATAGTDNATLAEELSLLAEKNRKLGGFENQA